MYVRLLLTLNGLSGSVYPPAAVFLVLSIPRPRSVWFCLSPGRSCLVLSIPPTTVCLVLSIPWPRSVWFCLSPGRGLSGSVYPAGCGLSGSVLPPAAACLVLSIPRSRSVWFCLSPCKYKLSEHIYANI